MWEDENERKFEMGPTFTIQCIRSGESWISYSFMIDQLCNRTDLAQIKLDSYLLYNSFGDNYAPINFMRLILAYLYY